MPTNINFGKKLGISAGSSIILPPPSSFTDTTSFLYDGVDDYIETNSTYSALDTYGGATSGQVTFSFWVKPTINTATRWLFGNPAAGATSWDDLQFGLYLRPGVATGLVLDFITNSQSQFNRVSNVLIPLNVWTHFTIQVDFTQTYYQRVNFFMNGGSALTVVSNGTYDFSTTLSSGSLRIGDNPSLIGNDWIGNINEFAIFDGLVSPSTLYNGGVAGDLSTIGGLLNWWRSENSTWNGSAWDVTDAAGSYPMTSSNMVLASRVSDVP